MGTKIEPPKPGFACPLCWGSADSPFGPSAPPDVIQVSFSGILKGSAWHSGLIEPPNGIWSVPPFSACRWVPLVSLEAVVQFFPNISRVNFFHLPGVPAFADSVPESCVQDFVNEITDPARAFYGGSAHVFV